MKKVGIRIIDKTPERGLALNKQVRSFNVFDDTETYFGSISLEDNSIRNEERVLPDIFLLHLNDMRVDLEPNCAYLSHIDSLPNRPVFILYSGGGITIREQSDCRLELEQDGKTWRLTVTDASRFCIVERPVNSADDLNVGPALEKYLVNGDYKEFLQALRDPFPTAEYLSALAILCQGYLIAHYPLQENCSPLVREAVGKMGGWLGGNVDAIISRAYQSREVTEATAWWGKAFGQFPNTPKGKKEEAERSLLTILLKECNANVPPKVTEIVNKIYKADMINDDDLVAAAFLQIRDRLAGGVHL